MVQLISLYAGYAGWRWISIPAVAAATLAFWLFKVANFGWRHYLGGPSVELIDIPIAYAELCAYSLILYLVGLGTRRTIEAIQSRLRQRRHQKSAVPHSPDKDQAAAP